MSYFYFLTISGSVRGLGKFDITQVTRETAELVTTKDWVAAYRKTASVHTGYNESDIILGYCSGAPVDAILHGAKELGWSK